MIASKEEKSGIIEDGQREVTSRQPRAQEDTLSLNVIADENKKDSDWHSDPLRNLESTNEVSIELDWAAIQQTDPDLQKN